MTNPFQVSPFLEAMQKLIEEKFPDARSHFAVLINTRYLMISLPCGMKKGGVPLMTLSDDALWLFGGDTIEFDIANPEFDPESLITQINDWIDQWNS